MSERFLSFDIGKMPGKDSYKLLASLIMPRPIAWIVTEDASGVRNAAPYSFFNIVSADPPIVAVSFSAAPDREGKDTLSNLRATGEMVVNLVSEDLAGAMNQTAIDAPRGIDETALAGLELEPSLQVRPPRIARSPASFECRLFQFIEPGGSSTIALARIVEAHVRANVFQDESKLYIDPAKLQLIGRMHGSGGYCTTRDLFTIERKSWPKD